LTKTWKIVSQGLYKASDFSLGYKNLNQNVCPLGRGPGLDEVGQKLKTTHKSTNTIDRAVTHKKIQNRELTKFFLVLSTRIGTSVEGLNSSLAQLPGEL